MSAYLNRLVQRFSPTVGDGGETQAVPFVRSRSPIVANDQLGAFGYTEVLDGEASEPMGVSSPPGLRAPSPASPVSSLPGTPSRVQRKSIGAVPSASTAPSVASPVESAVATPRALEPADRPAPVESQVRQLEHQPTESALEPDVSPPTQRQPLDPGDLFAPFPRFFDEQVRGTEVQEVGESLPITRPPATPLEPRVRLNSPQVSAEASPAPSPWVPYEPHAPVRPGVAPRPAPSLEPQPAAPPLPQRLVIAPKIATPRPLIPDLGEPARAPALAVGPRVSIGRVEIEIVPAQTTAPSPVTGPARNANGKLDIESISQIGPLGRHFPNRRRLRLRYR